MPSRRSRGTRTVRKSGRAAQFEATLEACNTYPLGEERNIGTLKLKGRLFRSNRAGHFILQRTGSCCEGVAVEIRSSAVKDFDLVFTDSAGRSSYVISVPASCPVRLVIPVSEESSRPRATLAGASPGTAAWQTAPWWGPRADGQWPGAESSRSAAAYPAGDHRHGHQPYGERSTVGHDSPNPKPTFVPE